MAWLALGVGGLLFRTVHLFFIRDVKTGLVWMTKILTDPFHDIKLYWQGAAAPDARRTDRPDGARARAAERAAPRGRSTGDRVREHLAQEAALDRTIRQRRVLPPPAVRLHRPRIAATKRARHGLEVALLGVVQAEDQSARAHPAERQAFCAQVVLQHPVVARRLGVAHGPDRRQVRDRTGQPGLAQPR